MSLAGRSLGTVARNALRPANYRSFGRMFRRYVDPAEAVSRYFRGTGDYPWRCGVRTPVGVAWPTLWSRHDMVTLNEVFCREDYRAGKDVGIVVDVGSNVGLSALYFLTRNDTSRCYLFEPVPENVRRLRRNLAGYESRYEIEDVAVADRAGDVPFFTEPSGRYGGLDPHPDPRTPISVTCRHIDSVLEQVLEREGRIDLLKLDTEGAEERTIRAARVDLLERVGVVYVEAQRRVELPRFKSTMRCETVRLVNRRPNQSRAA